MRPVFDPSAVHHLKHKGAVDADGHVLEDAGLWENSTVLVTSDHWYRPKVRKPWLRQGEEFTLTNYTDYRVPLLIKLPGQRHSAAYDTPFNAIITHDLILELIAKPSALADPGALVDWLNEHRVTTPLVCAETDDCETP